MGAEGLIRSLQYIFFMPGFYHKSPGVFYVMLFLDDAKHLFIA